MTGCVCRYIREEEPFRFLHAEGDIRFRQECHRFDNGLQMYYNISRVSAYSDSSMCDLDRCPIDYMAYSQARNCKQPISMMPLFR